MTRMTGAEALVRSLKQYGVDTIFGLPGVQLDHFFDALHQERDSIQVIHTRHEQAAAYMALGYAQSTGKVGVCAVVPGPGLLNAGAALATAYATNTPVLCVAGQIAAPLIDKGHGLLHEIPNQLAVARAVSKWAARIDTPREAPALVRTAFRHLTTGRPRPVELEMALDVMGQTEDVRLLEPVTVFERPSGHPRHLEDAARLLGQAEFPMIVTGGGSLGAGQELARLAETLQAPVVMSASGRGAVSDQSPYAQTLLGGRMLANQVDALLVIGTRFAAPRAYWGLRPGLPVVRIDIDPNELEHGEPPVVGMVADARQALTALQPLIERHNLARASRAAELSQLKEQAQDLLWERFQPQAAYAQALRAALPEEGFYVPDLTQMGHYSIIGFPIYRPRTYVQAGYQATLGFAFATALGVQAANPDAAVLCVTGDGGFLYTLQELATAVHHQLPVVTVVFNDNAYGNVRRIQREHYGGRLIASDLTNPDFVQLAASFGAAGSRATSPDELEAALRQGFASRRPTVIEVPVGEMESVWEIIGPPV